MLPRGRKSTMLLLVLLIFFLFGLIETQTPAVVKQINDQTTSLIFLQNKVIQLLNNYQTNHRVLQINEFMDETLNAQTNVLVAQIRGWAKNERESFFWINKVLNYLNLYVLQQIVNYVVAQASFLLSGQFCRREQEECKKISSLNQEITKRFSICNQEFYRSTSFEESILWYELNYFNYFPINVEQLNEEPYFRLGLRHRAQIRFLDNDLPYPFSPRHNYINELVMLSNAQHIILNWANQLLATHSTSDIMLSHIDARLFSDLENSVMSTFRTTIGTNAIPDSILKKQFKQLINIAILNEFIRFAEVEYDRHKCHPAHRLYENSLYDHYVSRIHANNVALRGHSQRLKQFLENLLRDNRLLTSAYDSLTYQSYHVGYIRANSMTSVRMNHACFTSNRFIQATSTLTELTTTNPTLLSF